MQFKAGYLGVCVVVMSLFGGLILGMVLNFDSETVSTTGYKYTTDITSLFNSSDEPYYTDYNPASNYTGYKNMLIDDRTPTPSGINYTRSNVANNYPVLVERGTTTAGVSGGIDNSSSFPLFTQPENFAAFIYDTNSKVNGSTVLGAAQLYGFKMTTLYDWINSVWGFNNFKSIVISLTYPGVSAPVTQARIITSLTAPGDGHMPDTLTVNVENKTGQFVDEYNNNITVGLYDSYIIYGAATQQEMYVNQEALPDIEWLLGTYDTTLSLSFTSRVTTKPVYEYMNPAGGVSLNGTTDPLGDPLRVVWDNETNATDYINVEIEVIVTGSIDQAIYIRYYGGDTLRYYFDITVLKTSTGWQVNIITDNNNHVYNFGEFPALSIVTSAIDHTVAVYPVTKFTDFNTYERSNTPLVKRTAMEESYIYDMQFKQLQSNDGYYDSATWSVVNTKILMDTRDSVLIDPSINLADYWPDMTAYRYFVQSVALYGESITINGVTYPVAADNTIELNNRDFKLSNFYLSYALDNHVYISFNNQSKTIDLGEITDRTLSFEGAWFFNMGLYEGYQSTEEVFNWIPSFTGGADMLFLLGLAILGITCVALVKTGHKFKMWDYIAIGAGALILLLLLGAL